MKIAIVTGSHRSKSQSERVGRYIEGQLKALPGVTPWLFSLANNPLPLWDETIWEGGETWKKSWTPIAQELRSADGIVLVSPEWAGMVPPGLKNFLLLCGTAEVGHKPVMITAVSSGIGGSYPISELRESGYKNNRLCYIPEHVIVRNAEKMLLGDKPADAHDESLRARLTFSLKVLIEYSKALKGVRESGVLDYKTFPYGM